MSDLVSIGEICGTYGTGGVVKVRPLTDFPDRFKGMNEVLVQKGTRLAFYRIESVSNHGNWYLFKFAGVDNREQARSLTGGALKVAEEDVFPLPDGCYYVFQLQGLKVYDEEKGFVGVIADVLQTGANDVYVVEGGPYGEVLIPVIKDVVREINPNAGKVQVKLLPGLIDERVESDAD